MWSGQPGHVLILYMLVSAFPWKVKLHSLNPHPIMLWAVVEQSSYAAGGRSGQIATKYIISQQVRKQRIWWCIEAFSLSQETERKIYKELEKLCLVWNKKKHQSVNHIALNPVHSRSILSILILVNFEHFLKTWTKEVFQSAGWKMKLLFQDMLVKAEFSWAQTRELGNRAVHCQSRV